MDSIGRALPEVGGSIADGWGEIAVTLPSNASLTGVSVRPQEPICPRTTVNIVVRVKAYPRRAVFLGHGVAHTPDVGAVIGDTPQSIRFAYSWTGDLPLEKDYESEVVAYIYNLTGAAVRWIVSAYVRELQ